MFLVVDLFQRSFRCSSTVLQTYHLLSVRLEVEQVLLVSQVRLDRNLNTESFLRICLWGTFRCLDR